MNSIVDWLWIDGQRTLPGPGSARSEIVDPATGLVVATVALGGVEDMAAAVASARRAFDSQVWAGTPAVERAAVLRRTQAILTDRLDELSRVLTRETGTPTVMSAASVSLMILESTADHLEQAVLQDVRVGMFGLDAVVRRLPTGVVGAIAPWNAPLYLSLNKVAPALGAGCSVVLKPAPNTPLDSYLLAEALADAGLPPGVFSMVPADREVGESLVRHSGVDKIAFTGSSAAGRRIAEICGSQLKRVSLELGGKSAAILLDDVDTATHLPLVAAGGLLNSGQACAALTRILVPAARQAEIVEALVAIVESFRLGDPFDPATVLGPIISASQLERIEGYVSAGLRDGAKLATGGGRPERTGGFWYRPTVLTNVDNSSRVAQEEIFGPVLAVISYDGGDEEAVRLANDSVYGLGGGVFSDDVERALDVAARIRTGTVGVNSLGIDPSFPFGGFKSSGIGREHGREGLDGYLETQALGLPMQASEWPARVL